MPGATCKEAKISIASKRIIKGVMPLIVKLYHEFLSGGLKFLGISARVAAWKIKYF